MAEIRRIEKGPQDGEYKGKGDIFIVPPELVPEGITEGEPIKLTIEGVASPKDESGLAIEIEKLSFDKSNSRADPLQEKIEEGLNIQLDIKRG